MAARPATRRPPAAPAAPASRAPVRDFSAGVPYSIEWDVRTPYDFLFSLSGEAGSTDDLPEADRHWLKDARGSLPKELAESVDRLFNSEIAIHTAPLVVDDPTIRTSADLVALIERTNPQDIVRAILMAIGDPNALNPLLDTIPAPDEATIAKIEACLPQHKRGSFMQIVREPEAAHEEIVAVLRVWLERYAEIEDRVAGMLQRDHELRSADRATLDGPDLIERTTGGVRWLPEAGVRRVVLAPSYFTRPYNFLFSGPDWRFFGYPIADAALDGVDPLGPPLALVRLHRALGDETRLRILKLLAERDLYLTEIAQLLELSKPTIKHHLRILRVAGLATVTESGTVTYYSLRRDPMEASSSELQHFLQG
jgi:DNA-binding transcriptional ArsR family regulator